MTADDLVRDLILRRFAEKYERLPHSAGHHILNCDQLKVADISTETGIAALCGTCEIVTFTARVACGHAQVEFEFGETGRLARILDDLAELAEKQETP